MVRARSASDPKSPLGVPNNENGPRATDRGPPITYKRSARTKKVRTRRAEVRTFDRILTTCATQAIEKGPAAERMVRTRSVSDQKGPLGVPMNENGPRARNEGPHITYKRSARTKKVCTRRAQVRTFDRILTTCATQAIQKGPLAERMVCTRSASDQKGPLGVLMNENGPRARDRGPHMTYIRSARSKKVRTRRIEVRTFDRILTTCAT